jgi:aspartate kinase
MLVLKFGGSSVGSIEKMKKIASKIADIRTKDKDLVIVVSAMGKTTNSLVEMANEAVANPSKREMDMLLATGEQVSISLLALILNDMGIPALSLTGFQAGIRTEGIHTKNKIVDVSDHKIKAFLDEGKVVIIAGFQGINESGDITTLGRGGSDTTAVAIAAKLGCRCEIYTDVDGIYTTNPALYPEAKKLDEISYMEMAELAHLGAKVMEPRSVEIGQKYGIEILVASAHGRNQGTLIKGAGKMLETKPITGISVIDNVEVVTINNYPNSSKSVAELFSRLAQNEINVDMINQSVISPEKITISFTCDAAELNNVKTVLDELSRMFVGFKVNTSLRVSKLSVVGLGMRSQSGVAATIFKIMADNDIPFHLVTTSEISISYAIPSAMVKKAVELISKAYKL